MTVRLPFTAVQVDDPESMVYHDEVDLIPFQPHGNLAMSSLIYGTIYRQDGTVINNAVVTAAPYYVQNNSGHYSFTTPGAAAVDVTASASGFTPKTTHVTTNNGAVKQVDFTLVPE